mmetsp:Transcript_18019/g.55923  ORF Transcript_18019/g.55923 Transcript_18019/m.55923 type:complete len:338 (-) Transcript_18019:1789-2802(-)
MIMTATPFLTPSASTASLKAAVSKPMDERTTTKLAPPTAPTAVRTSAMAFSLLAPPDFLAALASTLRSSATPLVTTARVAQGITASGSSRWMAADSFSISAGAMALALATRATKASPTAMASLAAPRVMASTRRMPLAVPSSCTIAKASACEVLLRCVPPQNSIDSFFHLASEGAASSSSTLAPTDTTRTGSGYVSPKTARRPLMARAASSGASLAYTGSASAMSLRTMPSTLASCSGVTGFGCEKSKRSRSAVLSEPFCAMWSPSTSRSAKLSECVHVWLGSTSKRRARSTAHVTLSPTASAPPSTAPACSTKPAATCTSATASLAPEAAVMAPVS